MTPVVASRSVDQGLTVPIRKAMNSNDVDSIRQYLSKPRLVSQATWQSQAAGAPLFATPFSSYGSLSVDPAFKGKISGFTGMRYTTNIKVVVNANPFQAGRLKLAYYPNGSSVLPKWRAHTRNRISISQLPGVEMNTMDKAMEASVPFLSYEEYHHFTDTTGADPLLFNVFVMYPLLNGVDPLNNSARVSVWVWFTDVELFGTTLIEPQSMVSRKAKVRTVTDQEERPLSTWLSATSKLASSLSSVPIISSIAAPTAVWTKYASGVASAFGYSRPSNGEPIRPMAPHYHASISNADGINVGSKLAANHDAAVRTITDFSPQGQDEMSISFIKKQWSFVADFTFPSTAGTGTVLWTAPLALGMGREGSAGQGFSIAPIEFLAKIARYYRGGIDLCFKFVKTGFHTGSITISYNVGATSVVSPTISAISRLHQTTVDIQDGEEVCLSFPFISPQDFLETWQPYGRVYVSVANALVRPETVSSFIAVQVYVRGMDDLEYSGFNFQNPMINRLDTIESQGGHIEETGEIVCQPVGGSLMEPSLTGLQMMDSMSESWTSVLQILKVGNRLGFYYPDQNGTKFFAFNPTVWNVQVGTPPGALTDPTYQDGVISAIKGCFAYQRGGYELNILPVDTAGGPYSTGRRTVTITHDTFFGNVINYELDPLSALYSSRALPNNPSSLATGLVHRGPRANNSYNYGLSATLPYKSLYRVNLLRPSVSGTIYGLDQARARFVVNCTSDDTILLRPADDYQLLYWVGVPPLVDL